MVRTGGEVDREILADIGGSTVERSVLGRAVGVVTPAAPGDPGLRHLCEIVVPAELHHVGRRGLVADETGRHLRAQLVVPVECVLLFR
jgi:hypothetical protein